MKQTKLTMNLDGLEEMLGQMGSTYMTRVGVLGSGNSREGGDVGNADLALIHIFGSLKNNIPPRDFLKMPLEMKKKELLKVLDSGTAKNALANGDYEKIYEILGAEAVGIVLAAFNSGGFGQWPPNEPATVKSKGSSLPLTDTGELKKSIRSDVVKRGEL